MQYSWRVMNLGWSKTDAAEVIEQCKGVASCETTVYRAGTFMFSPEGVVSDSFLVTNGVVGLYYGCPDSGILFMLAYPGDVIDACAPGHRDRGTVSGRALTDCSAYRLPRNTFWDPASARPAAANWMQACAKKQVVKKTALYVDGAKYAADGPASDYAGPALAVKQNPTAGFESQIYEAMKISLGVQ